MSYSRGLGQTGGGLVTLAARSPELIALQQALMRGGTLAIRTADGVISSTSPTLTAIAAWATANGLSSTGTARTSTGGLTIPQTLLSAIAAAPSTPTTTPPSIAPVISQWTTPSATTGKDGAIAPPSAVIPDVPGLTTSTWPTWWPWAAAGGGLLLLLGGVALARR